MVKVLLIGGNYLAGRDASDKNFWVDFLSQDTGKNKYHVISFNTFGMTGEKTQDNGVKVIFRKYLNFLSDKHMIYKSVFHVYLENMLTLLLNIRFIRKYMTKNKIDCIHFMDNYGPIMFFVKSFFRPCKVSVSAVSYIPKTSLYDMMLKLSLMSFDRIVPYSFFFKRKLFEMNILKKKLQSIHWGVLPSEKKSSASKKYILWSGFLQQTTKEDFILSYKIAQAVQKRCPDMRFIFAFKPEHYKSEYKRYESDSISILGRCNFKKIASEAYAFLCPIQKKGVIIAPPLTWIELMENGVPIITNNVFGYHCIIEDDVTGLVCKGKDEFIEKTVRLVQDKKKRKLMSESCIKKIHKDYNLVESMGQYEILWDGMVDEK